MDRQRIQLGAVALGVPRFDQAEGEWGPASVVSASELVSASGLELAWALEWAPGSLERVLAEPPFVQEAAECTSVETGEAPAALSGVRLALNHADRTMSGVHNGVVEHRVSL